MFLRPRRSDDKEQRPFEDNQGWRIPRIASQHERHPRRAITTPILLLTAALLLVALAVVPLVPLLQSAQSGTSLLSLLSPIHIFLIVLVLLFVVPLAWVFVGAIQRLRGRGRMVLVDAHCPDRDIQPVVNFTDDGEVHGWAYRLFCEFELYGQPYEATPEGREGKGFRIFDSPEEAEAYLNTHIGPDGSCHLRVDPTDPQHAELGEKVGESA